LLISVEINEPGFASKTAVDDRRSGLAYAEHRRMPGTASHQSAARALGIELLDDDGSQHLTVPRNDWRRVSGVVVHRADLLPSDVVVVDGRVTTTALRTVLDLARFLDPCGALVCADSALRQRLIDVAEFQERAAAALGPGAAQVRRVGRLADRRSGSVAETVARLLLVNAGLRPEPQFRLAAGSHPYDLALPRHRVLIEIQGLAFHRDGPSLQRDCSTATQAQLQKWLVLQFTWFDLRRRPAYVITSVRRALSERRPVRP
jgi:hypothetical protein